MNSKVTDYLINQLESYIQFPEIYEEGDREFFVAQFLKKGRRYDDFTESHYRTWDLTENYREELRTWASEELNLNISCEELRDAVIDDLFQTDGVVARLIEQITAIAREIDSSPTSTYGRLLDNDDPVPSPKIDAAPPA